MTPFILLPIPVQNTVCFWALLICLVGIADTILLWRQKRLLFCAAAFLCFSVGYLFLHVCREGTQLRLYGSAAPFAANLLRSPYALIPGVLLAVSAALLLLYRNARRWKNTHITSASVRESVDELPAGVCYYLEDGRCILVNHRMDDICFSLTGHSLQDGTALCDYVKDKPIHALSDGTAVSFRHRLLSYRSAPLHELIADDVTELYEKSERLKAENERIRQMAAGMKAYGETVADTVRRQEILQAKINIHDEMNRMILATKKAAQNGGSGTERGDILRMWRGQALLLCKEADTRRSSHIVSDLNALASVIGISLVWNGAPASEEPSVLSLFLAAAREAMMNAAKHAGAGRLMIDIEENAASLQAAFTNDGKKPAASIQKTGGLLSLSQRLERAGGQMHIETGNGFCLTVIIPKEETNHAI